MQEKGGFLGAFPSLTKFLLPLQVASQRRFILSQLIPGKESAFASTQTEGDINRVLITQTQKKASSVVVPVCIKVLF